MNKLNKILIALIVGFAMIFGMAGCNADYRKESQDKNDDLQSTVTGSEEGVEGGTENSPENKESGGSLYTLQEAYDNGWLTQADLLSIAYYHHSQSLGSNSSLTFNTELMGENFQPIEKSPETLSTLLNNTIRQTVLNDLNNEFDSNSFELKQIYIGAYYGAYNGGVAVIILYSRGDDIALNDVMREDVVANVTFYYSAYTVFFRTVSYSLSNTIMFWKENY